MVENGEGVHLFSVSVVLTRSMNVFLCECMSVCVCGTNMFGADSDGSVREKLQP